MNIHIELIIHERFMQADANPAHKAGVSNQACTLYEPVSIFSLSFPCRRLLHASILEDTKVYTVLHCKQNELLRLLIWRESTLNKFRVTPVKFLRDQFWTNSMNDTHEFVLQELLPFFNLFEEKPHREIHWWLSFSSIWGIVWVNPQLREKRKVSSMFVGVSRVS